MEIMRHKICPIIEECKFFNQTFLESDVMVRTYKKKYCSNSDKYNECKRYMAFLETGKQVPEYIMPNSQLPIDEICWKIE